MMDANYVVNCRKLAVVSDRYQLKYYRWIAWFLRSHVSDRGIRLFARAVAPEKAGKLQVEFLMPRYSTLSRIHFLNLMWQAYNKLIQQE